MFSLRVSQLKLVRVLPHGGLTSSSPRWSYNEKRVNALSWTDRVEYMSSGDAKKGDPFRDMDMKMLLHSIGCAYREIPWGEVGKAPNPIFWTSMASATGFWIPPITCIIFGYCNWISFCEVTWAALSSSFMGGIRYGVTLEKTLEPNWYNLTVCAIPPFVGFLSLTFLPQLFAYPVLLATMVVSSLHDALQPKLPVWYRSLRLMVVTSSALAMLLMFIFKILHLGSK